MSWTHTLRNRAFRDCQNKVRQLNDMLDNSGLECLGFYDTLRGAVMDFERGAALAEACRELDKAIDSETRIT